MLDRADIVRIVDDAIDRAAASARIRFTLDDEVVEHGAAALREQRDALIDLLVDELLNQVAYTDVVVRADTDEIPEWRVRRSRALELRRGGMMIKDIAKELGIKPQRAGDIIRAAERDERNALRAKAWEGKRIASGVTSDSPLEMLDLSVRVFNALKRIGVNTIGEASKIAQGERPAMMRNFGSAAQRELTDKLKGVIS